MSAVVQQILQQAVTAAMRGRCSSAGPVAARRYASSETDRQRRGWRGRRVAWADGGARRRADLDAADADCTGAAVVGWRAPGRGRGVSLWSVRGTESAPRAGTTGQAARAETTRFVRAGLGGTGAPPATPCRTRDGCVAVPSTREPGQALTGALGGGRDGPVLPGGPERRPPVRALRRHIRGRTPHARLACRRAATGRAAAVVRGNRRSRLGQRQTYPGTGRGQSRGRWRAQGRS